MNHEQRHAEYAKSWIEAFLNEAINSLGGHKSKKTHNPREGRDGAIKGWQKRVKQIAAGLDRAYTTQTASGDSVHAAMVDGGRATHEEYSRSFRRLKPGGYFKDDVQALGGIAEARATVMSPTMKKLKKKAAKEGKKAGQEADHTVNVPPCVENCGGHTGPNKTGHRDPDKNPERIPTITIHPKGS